MGDLNDGELQSAYELIKAGHSDQACEILVPLLRTDPNLVNGWFLLGHAVSDPQEKVRCFQQVLRLDPSNQSAQKQLDRLIGAQNASSIPAKPVAAEAVKETVIKKRRPVLLWSLVGFTGLFISLSGFGLFWRLNGPLLADPTPTIPGNTETALAAIPLAASTSSPKPAISPQPTRRPTITLNPTQTPPPSVTALLRFTLTATPTVDLTEAQFPQDFDGCLTPNGMSKQTAPFKIENFGKAQAIIYINGISRNGNYPIYCRNVLGENDQTIITLMWGNYTYVVLQNLKSSRGSFFVNQSQKATMRILENKIQIGEFP